MAENTVTPPSEKTTEPKGSAVPASVTPAADAAKPTTPVTPTPDPAPKPADDAAKAAADKAAADKAAADTAAAEKAATDKAAADKAAADALTTVPEKYEFALEGVKINEDAIAAITPAFKEAGLTQSAATKIVGEFVKFQESLPAAKNARDLEAIRQDDELGKLNFGRTQNEVNQALSAFTTADERTALSKMGMANDPTLVRMFRRIGKAMSDAGQTDAGERAATPKTTAQKLYGKTAGESGAS